MTGSIPEQRGSDMCRHDLTMSWCALCNPRLNVESSTYVWEREHPDVECDVLAKQYLEKFTDDDVRELFVQLLTDRLGDHRRGRIRAIEQRASESRENARKSAEHRDLNELAERKYKDDPWNAPGNTNISKRWRSLPEKVKDRERAAGDERYAEFVRDRKNDPEVDFLTWQLEDTMATFRERTKEAVLLELTSELLESSFAMGDGSMVTWGNATVDQHRRRFDMLISQASGSVRTAQRHQAAVVLLAKHKATSLSEVAATRTSVN